MTFDSFTGGAKWMTFSPGRDDFCVALKERLPKATDCPHFRDGRTGRLAACELQDLAPGRRLELRTLRLTDRRRPFRNSDSNPLSAAACHQMPLFATGVAVQTKLAIAQGELCKFAMLKGHVGSERDGSDDRFPERFLMETGRPPRPSRLAASRASGSPFAGMTELARPRVNRL